MCFRIVLRRKLFVNLKVIRLTYFFLQKVPEREIRFAQRQVGVVAGVAILNDIRPLPYENGHLPVKAGYLFRRILQSSGLGFIMVEACIGSIYYQFPKALTFMQ